LLPKVGGDIAEHRRRLLILLPKIGGNIAEHRRRPSLRSLRIARVELEQLNDLAVSAIVLRVMSQRRVKDYANDRHTDGRARPRWRVAFSTAAASGRIALSRLGWTP